MTHQVATAFRREERSHELPALARSAESVIPEQSDGGLDIAGLVRRAACGDRTAWERLVDQYSRLIWAMTRDFRAGRRATPPMSFR